MMPSAMVRSAPAACASLALAGLLFGCAGERAPGIGISVRDSAGVRIVENRAADQVWRIGSEPLFTIGWDLEGPAFTWPQSGWILPDGGALIGESGEGAIYRVAPDGSVTDRWGRKGEGPGEYQVVAWISTVGDSILAYDSRLARATVLDSSGTVLETLPFPVSLLYAFSGHMADGRILLTAGRGYGGASEVRQEWVFETQPVLSASLSGEVLDTVAELPHLRRWHGSRGAPPGPIMVQGNGGGFADGFAWVRSDEREVRWYDPEGRLRQVARWVEEPTFLSPETRDRLAQAVEEYDRSQGADEGFISARVRELEEGMDRHEGPLPYWSFSHVDRFGNAWLSDYRLPVGPPEAWRVVRRDGTYHGWVDVPGLILDTTDDRLLVVQFDDLDVAGVAMFELIKP